MLEKVRKRVTRKTMAVFAIILAFVIIGSWYFTGATYYNDYVLEVVNDGSTQVKSDLNMSVHRKITSSADKEFEIEIEAKNVNLLKEKMEVAIVVDTSYSMAENADLEKLKASVTEFTNVLLANAKNSNVSVSTYESTICTMTNDTIKISDAINSLSAEGTLTKGATEDGIALADSTFGTDDNADRAIVVFSDATDLSKDALTALEDKDIEVYQILADMTSTETGTKENPAVGHVSLLQDDDEIAIVDKIIKNINNIQVSDVLSETVLKYFDVEILEQSSNSTVEQTDTGLEWSISNIYSNETSVLKYKLSLKDKVEVDPQIAYREIKTNDKLSLKYISPETKEEKIFETLESPSITICETYRVEIQAINSKGEELAVSGVSFDILAKNEDGETVYEGKLVTDSYGYIKLPNIKDLGKVTIELNPTVDQVGYERTDARQIIVNNDYLGKGLSVDSDGMKQNVDINKRIIDIKYPIEAQGFNIKVNLSEKDNKEILLGNSEFRLIQPKLNNKYEMDVLYGITDEKGNVSFRSTVMTKAGTYEYILSQMTVQEGYESIGNVSLQITFNDKGEVTNIYKLWNNNVEVERISNDEVIVYTENVAEYEDSFNLEIKVRDQEDNTKNVDGASYSIEVTKETGFKKTISGQVTDSEGKIELAIGGSGYIKLVIREEAPKMGYIEDTVEKTIIVNRTNGQLQFISGMTPENLDAKVITQADKLQVNLTSKMRAEQNRVQLKLTDDQEKDITLSQVNATLREDGTDNTYNASSGEDGIVNFILPDAPQGQKRYTIEIQKETLPVEYIGLEQNIVFDIIYGEDGKIASTNLVEGNAYNIEYKEEIEDTVLYNTANLDIGIPIDLNKTVELQLLLKDEADAKAIAGAKYDISIIYGEATRNIKGRLTDEAGSATTRIPIIDGVTEIKLEIKQIEAATGYVYSPEVQQIYLTADPVAKTVSINRQTPNDLVATQNKGAQVVDNKVIYNHTNRKKTANDTFLNLHINKMDRESNLTRTYLHITSDSMLDSTTGKALNVKKWTDDYGNLKLENIKVANMVNPGEKEYNLQISEINSVTGDETNEIKFKLTYSYNEDKAIVEITDVEAIHGNQLVKEKTFDGYESNIGYGSNVYLDLYTNYDSVGNFAMNLSKKTVDGKDLIGGKYNVKISRPDGTKVVRNNVEINSQEEFVAVYVSKNTIIEITEVEAPIGYQLNKNTDIIKIESVDEITGEIVATVEKTNEDLATTIITDTQYIPLLDGTIKTAISVDLIDMESYTFRVGVEAIDINAGTGVEGYVFTVSTSKGAVSTTKQTDTNGKTSELVGGRFKAVDSPVKYTITGLAAPEYYKTLNPPISFDVYFKDDETIDVDKTMQVASQSANYGTKWEIATANGENDIDVKIKVEPQDPLEIEIQTVDAVTDANIADVNYEVTPSINHPGTGATQILVGYVSNNTSKTYQIKQTIGNNYSATEPVTLNITYDENGNITGTPTIGDGYEVVSYNGKKIVLKQKAEPKIPFVITNKKFFNQDQVIANAEFSIEASGMPAGSGTTDNNGNATTYVGTLGTSETIEYTVNQTKAAPGFARVDAFKIQVTYDANRTITDVKYVEGEEETLADSLISVSFIAPSKAGDIGYNGNDKGIVTITVLNYPATTVNIINEDRQDADKKLPGTKYKLDTTFPSTTEVQTDENGEVKAQIDKVAKNKIVTYTLTETQQSEGYQTIDQKVIVEVEYDENGYVKKAELKPDEGKLVNTFATVNKLETIVNLEDNFVINVTVRSTKLVDVNISNITKDSENVIVENGEYTVKTITEENQEVYTQQTIVGDGEVDGQAKASMDEVYENKKTIFRIKQVKKDAGYNWLDGEIEIEVQTDVYGKIVEDSWQIVKGNEFARIDSVDIETFDINITILHEEVEELGIHLVTTDIYDKDKKLEYHNQNGEVAELLKAYITDQATSKDYVPDEDYPQLQLTPGRLADGNTEIAHGEDYQSFGKYSKDANETSNKRIIRIQETATPNTFYKDGKQYESNYKSIGYETLIEITLNEEGKIINAEVKDGQDQYIGWLADGRYIKINGWTNYKLKLEVCYYPQVQVSVKPVDKYTGDKLQGNFDISTKTSDDTTAEDLVEAGYVGNGTYIGYKYYMGEVYTTNFEQSQCHTYKGISPIEEGEKIRYFYVHEKQEPNSPYQYQKYKHRYGSSNEVIATIAVKYNNLGEIDSAWVENENSNSNIASDYIVTTKVSDESKGAHFLDIEIQYAPTTKMNAVAIDEVTKAGLSNIKLYPYVNTTPQTNQSYAYNGINYSSTDTDGKTTWDYWGANIAGTTTRYVVGTQFEGTEYNGYFLPGNIIIDVSYGDNGLISKASVVSTNTVGEPNAEISWKNNELNINVLLERKFSVVMNKKDVFDQTQELSAVFTVVSDKNEVYTIASGRENTIGKIHAGETVKYTLSETKEPNGYLPLNNIEFYVTFDKTDGHIVKCVSDNEYFQIDKIADAEEAVKSYKTTDLEVTVLNEPRMNLQIDLLDKLYPTLKLAGGQFNITNNKGDNAIGELTTDTNGVLDTYCGPVYPGETITYTITQTNVVNGYKQNNTIVKLQVKFKDDGNIEEYKIIEGQSIVSMNQTEYQSTKKIKLDIYNEATDVIIGIEKYDKATQKGISDIKFKVRSQEVGAANSTEYNFVTNADGRAVGLVDYFKEATAYRTVEYTISEIETQNSYRKAQDVVLRVTYATDGQIINRNVVSNPSNVKIEVATNGNIKYVNGIPVHIKLSIPSDNSYDLIIKNEDIDFAGLGIEETQYDVTIAGDIKTLPLTDENGLTQLLSQTDVGRFQIYITERAVGEGYRADNTNNVILEVEKGIEGNSLTLISNSNPDKVTVVVDEAFGTITVTFKNESKIDLSMLKTDITTGQPLQGAIFEISAQEISDLGTLIGEKQIITTEGINDTTLTDGLLSFDLGKAPRNKTIQYTFKEKTPPAGYNVITPMIVEVTYDMYGRIVEPIVKNSYRIDVAKENQKTNCRDIRVTIKNGEVSPAFDVKVVSEDSITGARINNSEFDVIASDENQTLLGETKAAKTGNLMDNGKVEQEGESSARVVETGVVLLEDIEHEGKIKIAVEQKGTSEGFIYGANLISGTVELTATHVSTNDTEKELEMTVDNNGGFEVIVDNANREVTIKVKNDPQVVLNVNKVLKTKDDNSQVSEKNIAGAVFTATARVESDMGVQDTDLAAVSAATDQDGNTTLNLGLPYPGKLVTYVIHENKMMGYEQLNNIELLVSYDIKGKIKYYEILSSTEDFEITNSPEGRTTIDAKVRNVKELGGYKIVLEKHNADEYTHLISDVRYNIKVKQEYGKSITEWQDITDLNGLIESTTFDGYGRIIVEATEIATIDGFKLDTETRRVEFIRNKSDGKLEIVTSNVDYEFNEEEQIIYIRPVNEQVDDSYTLMINKTDGQTNALITNNPASFKISRVNYQEVIEEDGSTTQKEIIESIATGQTDTTGKIRLSDLPMPEEMGTYTYLIEETAAPKGYAKLEDKMEIKVTFGKNENGEKVITNVEKVAGDVLSILSTKENVISLRVNNSRSNDTQEEIDPNAMKYNIIINKKDSITRNNILDNATFEIRAQGGEMVRADTKDDGIIEIKNIVSPKDEGSVFYDIQELCAPYGYRQNQEKMTLQITFEKDADGMMQITSVGVNGPNIEARVNYTNVEVDIFNDRISYEELYLTSKVYRVTDKYVERVQPFTKVSDYLANMESNGVMTVYDAEGNQVNPNANVDKYVGTKFIIKAVKDGQSTERTIIVIGDVNSDGRITISDTSRINRCYLGLTILDEIYTRAADVTDNTKLTISDTSKINRYYLEIIKEL